nr:hypothetical protein [uncultured Undibacterium sp.]
MYQAKLRRHSIFFIVVLLHLGVFFSWQYGSKLLLEVDRQPKQHRLLHLIYLPAQNKVPPSNSATSNPAKTPQKNIAIESTRIKRLSALSISSPNQSENKIENKTEEQTKPTPANETIQRPLQRNIAELTQSLKADFQQQEKNLKTKPDAIKQFGNAVADAARIPREGVKIENKHTYDDRPVSKVITPFGTYCIRHRKAGELPELVPAPVPSTCGRL